MSIPHKHRKDTAPSGCLALVVIFVALCVIMQCNDARSKRYNKQAQPETPSHIAPAPKKATETQPEPVSTAPSPSQVQETYNTTRNMSDEEEMYGDQYDNPDFDDAVPGDEFDEEFMGSEGDPEVYPE